MRVAVLMTCHNRKEMTLRCLESLRGQMMGVEGFYHGLHGFSRIVNLGVFLNDDGCTDGTGEAVQDWFKVNTPLFTFTFHLHLIQGSGNDYWAKGMERAWKAAVEWGRELPCRSVESVEGIDGKGYDAFLWLNDDVVLKPDALDRMLQVCAEGNGTVAVGSFADATGKVVYGLNVALGMPGNCVLVPRCVYEKVGMICGKFAHGWADCDYGFRVERAGFKLVSAGVVGMAEGHDFRPSLKGLSLRARLALLRDPRGWNLHDLWLLRCRNWNVFYAMASCAHMLFVVLRGER